MQDSKCPLCGSFHVKNVDKISKDRLRSVYLKEYNTDIRRMVKEDLDLFHCQDCDLKFFNPCVTGDQDFYSDLQKFEWYYKDDKYEYGYVTKFFQDTDSVLEIGCGKGAFSKLIPHKNYVGLEFSENAKMLANADGIDVRNESIEYHAQSNSEKYDVVCSFQVVEHVTSPKAFLENAVACLKPGGTFILTCPSEDSWLQYKQDFALNMPPHHVSKWTDKCLINIGKQFGIEMVEIHHEPLNSFHIPWFFNSMVVYQLNKTLGISHSLIKTPSHWFSDAVAKLLFLIFGRNLPEAFHGHGHTVIAVYKKSANGVPPKVNAKHSQ